MATTTLHTSLNIAWALSLSDRDLRRLLTITTPRHRYTVAEVRLHLQRQAARGLEYLMLTSACDARRADGSCAGHRREGA